MLYISLICQGIVANTSQSGQPDGQGGPNKQINGPGVTGYVLSISQRRQKTPEEAPTAAVPHALQLHDDVGKRRQEGPGATITHSRALCWPICWRLWRWPRRSCDSCHPVVCNRGQSWPGEPGRDRCPARMPEAVNGQHGLKHHECKHAERRENRGTGAPASGRRGFKPPIHLHLLSECHVHRCRAGGPGQIRRERPRCSGDAEWGCEADPRGSVHKPTRGPRDLST